MRQALSLLVLAATAFAADSRPKVRAITAFINLDAHQYQTQIVDTMRFLDGARETFRAAGFEVEGVRIATQPFAEYTRGLAHDKAVALLAGIDELAGRLHFAPAIGPAMLGDGDAQGPVDLLIDVLSKPSRLNASLVTASTDGIHWKAIREAARLIKSVGERSERGQGNFNFAAIAMLKPDGPFFPGAYHLGAGRSFAVGLEGASVVEEVFARTQDAREAEAQLAATLARHMKDAEAAAQKVAAAAPGWTYAGIDPTPAPLGDVSIGRAIESFTGGPFGTSGTMTAAAIITRAVQSVPVKRTGYSGLMVPVLEDKVLAQRWAEGDYSIDSLLAYSAVCAGGIDTVPLPGEVSEQRIARILGDVATLAYKWNKPLAARLLPAPGKKPGDRTEFGDSRMANTVIQPLKP
ncbi:MAG TPA: DUF711 family protein [Bryobacteraceae bacterium]|nr:DUF711 family protein [Bryobacteraceae bacterium]